ncbi:MAG: hypothetical protein AAF224_14070 [Pseudomonadota bacterium]
MSTELQALNDFLKKREHDGHDEVIIRCPDSDQKLMKVTKNAFDLLDKLAQTDNARAGLDRLKKSYEEAAGKALIARIELLKK